MVKIILTSKLAERIQDDIFRKMTAAEKIRMASQFFTFGKKLNELNNRKINGNRRTSRKNSKDIRKT